MQLRCHYTNCELKVWGTINISRQKTPKARENCILIVIYNQFIVFN